MFSRIFGFAFAAAFALGLTACEQQTDIEEDVEIEEETAGGTGTAEPLPTEDPPPPIHEGDTTQRISETPEESQADETEPPIEERTVDEPPPDGDPDPK